MRIPPHEYSQRQSYHDNVFYERLDEPGQGWNWQRRRRAEGCYDHVHDNEDAKAIQQRAGNGIAAQEWGSSFYSAQPALLKRALVLIGDADTARPSGQLTDDSRPEWRG